MARGVWTRRWLAASGGLLINGLILGALALIEEPPPVVGEQPVLLLDLERPERPRSPRRSVAAAASSASPSRAVATPSDRADGETGPPANTSSDPTQPAIDPAWRVDPKVVDRWRLIEGDAAMRLGRVKRACLGSGSEHMTQEEKEACYAGWGARRDRRPSPGFIGPVDETPWQAPQPELPSRYDTEGARFERCRDYRRGRTPGFSERNVATGSPPPSLRERGCL